MPDLHRFLTFGPHRGLSHAYDRWLKSQNPRGYNATEEQKATYKIGRAHV